VGISFKAGDVGIALGPEGDLAKYLQPGLQTVLHFKESLQSIAEIPDATLGEVPSGLFRAGFSTDQEATWSPDGTNVTLSFRPELSGLVTFTKTGPLFTYLDGDENAFSVKAPDGFVYVSIAFQVNIAVGGGAAFSAGEFGVKANLSEDDTFTIANHRCFPATTKVFDALRAGFEGFTLPFRADGVRALGPDDLLDFQFLGKLGLGFGLTYGFTGSLLGGRSAGEIGRSFENGIARVALKAKPTFTAGASFAMQYDHEDAFRFVFRQARGENGVSLTILKMDKDTLTTRVTAGVTLDTGASVDLQAKTEHALDAAVDHTLAGIDGNAAQTLKDKLKAAGNGVVNKLTERANDAANGLLSKASGRTGIEVVYERATTDAALFQLTFDRTDAGSLGEGLRLAMEGRIAEAALLPGVTLSPGSLIEHAFAERAAFTFQFFDLWKWTDAVEYVDKIDIVYAGNGVLRLIGTEGVTHSLGIVGHESRCDLHFRATAKQGVNATTVSDLDLALCFDLLDQKTGDAEATTGVLRACKNDRLTAAAADALAFMREDGRNLTTSCEFASSVLHQFSADEYHDGGPPPLPHPLDSRNYAAFRNAVIVTVGEWLGFKDYDDWATFNRAAIDQDESTIVPDRRNSGNFAAWPSAFSYVTDTARRQLCRFSSESAREFMNFCDDLGALCEELDDVRTEEAFRSLLGSLNGIIKNDVPVDFIKAVLLGLITIACAPPSAVTTIIEKNTMRIKFAIARE
jgi:hypothetical protein